MVDIDRFTDVQSCLEVALHANEADLANDAALGDHSRVTVPHIDDSPSSKVDEVPSVGQIDASCVGSVRQSVAAIESFELVAQHSLNSGVGRCDSGSTLRHEDKPLMEIKEFTLGEHPPALVDKAPLKMILGTWSRTGSGKQIKFSMVRKGYSKMCKLEFLRDDGSVWSDGWLDKTTDRSGWRIYTPRNTRDDPDWRERVRISPTDDGVLEKQMLETWGDWDYDNTEMYRKTEVVQERSIPFGQDVVVGTGDGHINFVSSGHGAWHHEVRESKLVRRCQFREFTFPVHSLCFSPDGKFNLAGTAAGEYQDKGFDTLRCPGHVSCHISATGQQVWKWSSAILHNQSILHVGVIDASPCGQWLAAACNTDDRRMLDCDGVDMNAGNDIVGRPCLVCLDLEDGIHTWTSTFIDNIASVAHSPHSSFLVVGFLSPTCGIYESICCISTKMGQVVWTSGIPNSCFHRSCKLSFSPCGQNIACLAVGLAEKDWDDDRWTISCLGMESGQIKWTSHPVYDQCSSSERDVVFSKRGDFVCLVCREDVQHRSRNHYIVALLSWQTGELVRKAHVSFVDTVQCLKIACLSDSQVLIALDAWQEGDPCLKLYQFPVQDPPHDWKGHSVAKRQRKFHIGENEWPAASKPDLVWSCRMAHTSDRMTAFAFKPVVGSSTNVASSDSEMPCSESASHDSDIGDESEQHTDGHAPTASSLQMCSSQAHLAAHVGVENHDVRDGIPEGDIGDENEQHHDRGALAASSSQACSSPARVEQQVEVENRNVGDADSLTKRQRKRRSHHQRMRAKQWKDSVRISTPASYD